MAAGSYDSTLVTLSILVAIFASFTALDLSSRLTSSSGWSYYAWLAAASVAMGGGIWSMHFVAMLAFSLPSMTTSYDVGLTLLSLALPILVTGAAFFVVGRKGAEWRDVAASGLFMGLGIVAMHYTGMAAMRMPADLSYDKLLVALSVLIAVGASTVGLWLAFRRLGLWERVAAAVAMGIAISGMHYTGMAAASFTMHPGAHDPAGLATFDQTRLALAVAATTFLILFLALIAAMFDRRFALLAEREAMALRRSEERFRSLYDRTPVPLHSLDADGNIRHVNQQWLDLLGYGREEVIGRHISEFQTDVSAQRTREVYWPEFLARREINNVDVQFVTKGGGVLDIRLSSRIVPNPHADYVETYSVLVDVTAQRKAEEALRQAQKMEAVGQLTGGVAHDFNNLLTVISGNLEFVGRAVEGDARLHRMVASAQRAAERGGRLTAQLLAFSRRQTLHPEVLRVDEVVRDFSPLVRRAVGEAIELELRNEAALWPCHIDPAQFESAVLNLAINARDAMPTGGRLAIASRNVEITTPTEAGGDPLKPGRYVEVAVSDTGQGMPPDVMQRAFEPFFTTKPKGSGTGLGLSMVYGFVRQSGGHVTIKSGTGVGTTIVMLFPASDREAPVRSGHQPEPVPTAAAARQAATILVAEDDQAVLEIIQQTLSGQGYRVLVAGDGPQAISILEREEAVDLLLSDVVMPSGMSGVDLAREARRRKQAIRVLLTSGYPGDELSKHGGIGEFPMLSKPFRQAELAERVRAVLR